jgi:hypothetical protein
MGDIRRSTHVREDEIEIHLTTTGCEDINKTKVESNAVMSTVVNIRDPERKMNNWP